MIVLAQFYVVLPFVVRFCCSGFQSFQRINGLSKQCQFLKFDTRYRHNFYWSSGVLRKILGKLNSCPDMLCYRLQQFI